jgi:radical SAM protein with 4Fe4S-binding SPASM domain
MATIHENLKTLKRIKAESGRDRPFVAVKMLDTFDRENELFRETYADVADEAFLDKPHNWIATGEKNFVEALYGSTTAKATADLETHRSARIACTMPFYTLVVRSNGDVSPCCIDWVGATTLGSVPAQTLREVWAGDRMLEFWKMQLENRKHENESCRNCEFFSNDHYMIDNIDGFPVEKLRRPK